MRATLAVVLALASAVNYWRGFTREDEIPLDERTHVTAVEG